MTPEEFKMLYDKDFKINLKLEKLEKMYIKQELLVVADYNQPI